MDLGHAFFRGLDATGNTGLWVINGTAAGTYELTGINGAASFGIAPTDIMVFNGEVLFNGYDAGINSSAGLWATNGTAAGTYELTGISGAYARGLDPELTGISGGGLGLWVTDGTAAGTHELTGISGANSRGVIPNNLYDHDSSHDGLQWRCAVQRAYQGQNGLDPRDLTVFNGEVLFSGTDAAACTNLIRQA